MEDKIKNHVNELFENAPKTKNTVELRQEIIANLMEKYHDLIKNGATESEAYNIVINSIGDVDELIKGDGASSDGVDTLTKKNALLKAISVVLYITCALPIIVLSVYGQPILGLVFLFVFVAVATAIQVYISATRPKYEKVDDTLVEEFKEWKETNKGRKERKNAYSGILWALIVALYFIISFATGAWFVTWVIFVIGGAIESIISLNVK